MTWSTESTATLDGTGTAATDLATLVTSASGINFHVQIDATASTTASTSVFEINIHGSLTSSGGYDDVPMLTLQTSTESNPSALSFLLSGGYAYMIRGNTTGTGNGDFDTEVNVKEKLVG